MASLTISGNTFAIAPNISTSFLAINGSPPYSYTVLPGGTGGTIASNGVYTAPSTYGNDVIQVVDNVGAVADATVLVGSPLELVCDIIQNYMGLSQGQTYIFDQKINIPIDSRLYVAIGVASCRPFGNTNYLDANGVSQQSVNMLAVLDINILSRSTIALNSKEQVILALYSTYAQQQMALNSFNIGRISTGFVNLSEVDGAAIPYRFVISVQIQYFISGSKSIGYYTTFSDSIITNP